MKYRYDVDLVAYDNDTSMLINVTAEGEDTDSTLLRAIAAAKKLLKDDVEVEVNGFKPLPLD